MSTYVFEKEEQRSARREQAKALLQTLPQFKGKAVADSDVDELFLRISGAPWPTDDADAALLEACAAGDEKKCAEALDRGARPGAADADGFTALIKAVVGDHRACVNLLLKKGAPVDGVRGGHTPLRAAALHGRASLLSQLLEEGADASIPSAHDRTPLMGACFPREDADPRLCKLGVFCLLADDNARASIGFQNDDGDTALHLALARSNGAVAEILAEAGAPLDVANNAGETCAERAAKKGIKLPERSDDAIRPQCGCG